MHHDITSLLLLVAAPAGTWLGLHACMLALRPALSGTALGQLGLEIV